MSRWRFWVHLYFVTLFGQFWDFCEKISDVRQSFFVSVEKLHSTCQNEQFVEKAFLKTSNFFSQLSVFQRKFFNQGCQIMRKNILKNLDTVIFFSDIERKFFGTVDKRAFYVSRGITWSKTLFWNFRWLLHSRDSSGRIWVFWQKRLAWLSKLPCSCPEKDFGKVFIEEVFVCFFLNFGLWYRNRTFRKNVPALWFNCLLRVQTNKLIILFWEKS